MFYRVDQVGSPPQTGPLLFVANHANALLDPAIVWATAGRDVRFLAKSTLFDGPFKPFLAGAGAIPVYRRRDEGVDMSRNAEMFSAVDAALRAGDAVCIFPEGMSHSQGRLASLRTGAARIVLAAEGAGTAVALVAVGLNFDRKTAFRSRVTVVYGPAFRATEFASPAGADQAAAVRALTEGIGAHMKRLLIEADPARMHDSSIGSIDSTPRRGADPTFRMSESRGGRLLPTVSKGFVRATPLDMKRSSCGCGATTSGCADSDSAIAISTWMYRAPTLSASPCAKEHSR